MEQLVREEVARVKDEGSAGYVRCWCRLCETDVVALALTLLPPLYCRTGASGHTLKLIRAGTISDAVQSALKRVAHLPKHRPGTWPASPDEVTLVNYTYEVVAPMVGPALGLSATRCTCENCRFDTLAYTLNRYPAKYGVILSGRRSLHPTYLDFMRYELGMLINHAARVVASHPHHGS